MTLSDWYPNNEFYWDKRSLSKRPYYIWYMKRWVTCFRFKLVSLLEAIPDLCGLFKPLLHRKDMIGWLYLTCLTELRGASAAAWGNAHDGDYTGAKAGSALFPSSTQCSQSGVWLAAIRTLQSVDFPTNTRTLQHAAAGWMNMTACGGRKHSKDSQ